MISTPVRAQVSGAELRVDLVVQRKLDNGRANTIAANFDPTKLGVIALSAREVDGPNGPTQAFYIVDGQHRVAGGNSAGYDGKYEANVYYGLTLQEEAILFTGLNNTRKPGPIDSFRIRVQAGDPEAVAVDQIITKAGWRLAFGASPATLSAISALSAIYAKDPSGPTSVAAVALDVVTRAWGHSTKGADGRILSGVGELLLRYRNQVDVTDLVSKMAKLPGGPDGLLGRAAGQRTIDGGRIGVAVAKVLHREYNQYKRQTALSPW